MGTLTDYPIRSKHGEPPWELATFYPSQGAWTKGAYLNLTDGRRGIEFNAGALEFLPLGTEEHQEILKRLLFLLEAFVAKRDLGVVLFAGIRVETAPDKIREPDLAFMRRENASRRANRYWTGADLVMEVVSGNPGDRDRDYLEKRAEYEAAGVSEYWIVDPAKKRVTVLKLTDGKYAVQSEAENGDTAESALLSGFAVNVADLFETK